MPIQTNNQQRRVITQGGNRPSSSKKVSQPNVNYPVINVQAMPN